MIVFTMVTQPNRYTNLKLIIPNILEQCDEFNIILNGYDFTPEFDDEKIQYYHVDAGTGAEAKLDYYFLYGKNDYYFTIDDDILYPKNYVEKMIEKDKISCVHGGFWNLHRVTKHRDFRKTYTFTRKLQTDRQVQFPGTGTMCIPGGLIDFNPADFQFKNMVDPYISVWAAQQKIPIICKKRPNQWLKALPEYGSSIVGNNPNNQIDELITKNINHFKWIPRTY